MIASEEFIFQHRQDSSTKFKTWFFVGSTNKCPKYYNFIESDTNTNEIEL
jgi:hypothetical protein